jgi:hypothetical protein
MKALLLALLALLAAPVPAAAALPERVEAEYHIYTGGLLVGRVHESFVRTGETYSIRSVTRSEGMFKVLLDGTLTVESEGRIGPAGLQPLRYEQRRSGDPGRDLRATFDWKKGVMHSEYKGEAKDVALPAGTQDRLSVIYQFMNLPAGEERVRLHMSNGRRVGLYTYVKTEEARLRTPAGEFDTRRFERVSEGEGERKTQVWVAKEHYNLPVRIVFDDPRGLSLEQTLFALRTQ